MGWLDKIFGRQQVESQRSGASSQPAMTQQFEDDAGDDEEQAGQVKRRRELLQVVLRDTMRRHGIPSDWIECRILTVVSTTRGTGMHILLVVKQGDDRLATYVHAFQETFMSELLKFEPKAKDWVFSVSWQFEGKPQPGRAAMPDPASWNPQGAAAKSALAPAPMASPAPAPAPAPAALDMPAAAPLEMPVAAAAMPAPAEEAPDSELEEDLQALFKIRDAALSRHAGDDDTPPDFEPTRPGEEEATRRA